MHSGVQKFDAGQVLAGVLIVDDFFGKRFILSFKVGLFSFIFSGLYNSGTVCHSTPRCEFFPLSYPNYELWKIKCMIMYIIINEY